MYGKHIRQGFFKPRNPDKYVGNPNEIIYRSNLERRYMKYLDEDSRFVKWASEEHIIPYISPVDGKPHRYFVDLVVKTVTGDVFFVEIKPYSQTMKPEKKNQKEKTFLNEVKTWAVNEAKWKAATAHAKAKGAKFIILTEKDLKTKI